ncbi:phospholipid carrier-dependent glycosyltransferase [Synechococcus sp. H60.2]|uniref:phospholipid carrier-dependent glycosyltransferase n=1 Tax=Synechococcus sp. H60.2 TaxID=2964518 RepID=UPI0039C48290
MKTTSSRLAAARGGVGIPFLPAWAGLGMAALLLLLVWNWTDPLPPAWDEAQHLLQAQAFGDHLRRFRWEGVWWQQFLHLNQRYPPLAYWLGIPLAALHPFSRADGQLLNWVLLGILTLATQRLGQRIYHSQEVGWLAAALLVLYPGIAALAHVYMLELPLLVAVTLAFWAIWAYGEEPTWWRAEGVGAGVAAALG